MNKKPTSILLFFSTVLLIAAVAPQYTASQITTPLFVHLKALPLPVAAKLDKPIEWEDAKISGQCFIVTKGGDSIKLALVSVSIYDPQTTKNIDKYAGDWMDLIHKAAVLLDASNDPAALDVAADVLDMHDDGYSVLPDPLDSVKTDADGKFTLKRLPKGDFFLIATGSRKLLGKTEHYVWEIPAKDVRGKEQLFLSNDNQL